MKGKPGAGISLLLLKNAEEAARFNVPIQFGKLLSTIHMPSKQTMEELNIGTF